MSETSDTMAGPIEAPAEAKKRPVCGIVRPIAASDDVYTESHWVDVHNVVAAAASKAGYELRLVSEGGTGIIVADIIEHLYYDPITICDVSGRNPNVMFELGMRVTFEKPIIIIKDDVTPFSFDITPIKHLVYRRDLRMPSMISFQAELTEAIIGTMKAAESEHYKHYLQQFGPIDATQLGSRQIDVSTIVEGMDEMRRSISAINSKIDSRNLAVRRVSKTANSSTYELSNSSPDGVVFNIDIDRNMEVEVARAVSGTKFHVQVGISDRGATRTSMSAIAFPAGIYTVSEIMTAILNAARSVDPSAQITL